MRNEFKNACLSKFYATPCNALLPSKRNFKSWMINGLGLIEAVSNKLVILSYIKFNITF